MPTTAYQAGIEANQTQVSYVSESAWGTNPSGAFQAIRYNSETLSDTKTRQRPSEINANREAIQGVTTKEEAGGSLSISFSFGTFDALFQSLLGGTWQSPISVTATIALAMVTSTTATLTATAGTFTGIVVGQWIRTLNYTHPGNNDIWRVTAATTTVLNVTKANQASPPITESPGSSVGLRASNLQNGTTFQSLYIQQQLSPATSSNLWLQYPGCYVSKCSLTGSIGKFFDGSFDIVAQQEISATAQAGTSVTAAPSGSVANTVSNFGGVFIAETALVGVVDTIALSIENTGAANEFGMGSTASQGVLMGSLMVSGTMKVYFQNFTYYTRFKNEVAGTFEFIVRDGSGNAYVFTMLNATLIAGSINVTGPNTPVYCEYKIEASPQTGGGTLMIDRLPAT